MCQINDYCIVKEVKMKIIFYLMLIISFSFLTAQNVFVWDNDLDYTVMNPEDPWTFVGMEEGLVNALLENGITATVDILLPDDLSDYDVVFATVGIWCDG